MLTPSIVFRYSDIYDELFKGIFLKEQKAQKSAEDTYPAPDDIHTFIEMLNGKWQLYEKLVTEELSKITTLGWKEKRITCYVVGRTTSFSDPLTIPAYSGHEDYAVDVLTHELIYRLFIQEGNYEKTYSAWKHIHTKYSKYSADTRIHIPLEAIHTAVYITIFDEDRLKRDRDFLSLMPEYKAAWEAVERDGYRDIINDFTKRTASNK